MWRLSEKSRKKRKRKRRKPRKSLKRAISPLGSKVTMIWTFLWNKKLLGANACGQNPENLPKWAKLAVAAPVKSRLR